MSNNHDQHTTSTLHSNNLKDYLCNFKIDVKSLNFIKFLSKTPRFARSFFVSTLPRFLEFGEFLKPFYSSGNINTSIFVTPLSEGKVQNNLNAIISKLSGEITQATENKEASKAKADTQKKQEAENLRDEVSTNFNRLFEVTVLSTIFAKSREELDSFSDQLGVEMSKSMTNIKSAWAIQEEGFSSNMPYMQNVLQKNNIFDTFAVSATFPFMASNISHPSGIPLGINRQSHTPIFIDNFYSTLQNHNMVIAGEKQCGKYLAANILASRSLVLENVQNIFLDSDKNFTNLTQTLDGRIITLKPGSNIIINPFDIEPEISADEITGKKRVLVNLQNKVDDVTNILMTMAKGNIQNKFVNEMTRKIILETITEEYKALKINDSPESLFSSFDTNLVGNKIARDKKQPPTLDTWYKRLCAKAAANSDLDLKYHYEYLMTNMKKYLREFGGEIPYFDGLTTVAIPKNTMLINFDLSALEAKFLKPLAQQVILSWLWESIIKSNSKDKSKTNKKRVILDDASILVPYMEATNFLNALRSRLNTKNTSLTLVTDSLNEYYNNKKALDILVNASIKIIMKQNEDSMSRIKQSFSLTTGECDFLKDCSNGEGILIVDGNSAQIYISPIEEELGFSDEGDNLFMAGE
jgi:type IV secretory pathway VirB4 component